MSQMALGGIRFTDFHVGYSVCTPSRAALLTGRLCPRTGVCSNFGPYSRHGMNTSELTMANLLSDAGCKHATPNTLPGPHPTLPTVLLHGRLTEPRALSDDAHMIGKW